MKNNQYKFYANYIKSQITLKSRQTRFIGITLHNLTKQKPKSLYKETKNDYKNK